MKRRMLQGLVTLGLLALVILYADIPHMVDLFARMDIRYGLPALALLLVQNDLTTRRWAIMLRAFVSGPGYFRLLRIQYAALFAQLFLPTSIGGAAVRTGLLFRIGTPVGVAVNSVVLDRIIALAGLLLLAAAFMPAIVASVSIKEVPVDSLLGGIAIIVGCLALGYAALRYRPLSFWLDLAKRTPARHIVQPLEQAMSKITAPGRIIAALVFSLVGQLIAIVAVYLLAIGGALDVQILNCILIMPPVMLLSALPISIAGWGVRESAMVFAFGLLGVSHEAALALSIQFAVLGYIAAAPGALAWIAEADRGKLKNPPEHTSTDCNS